MPLTAIARACGRRGRFPRHGGARGICAGRRRQVFPCQVVALAQRARAKPGRTRNPLRNNAIVQVGRGALAATFGANLPLALIAGPCQMESRAHALETAQALKEIAVKLKVGLVYKTSFDKANRTSGSGARGVGLEAALPVFAEIREFDRPAGDHRRARERASAPGSPRRSTRCRSRPSSAARPTSLWPRRARGGRSTSRKGSSSRPGT